MLYLLNANWNMCVSALLKILQCLPNAYRREAKLLNTSHTAPRDLSSFFVADIGA